MGELVKNVAATTKQTITPPLSSIPAATIAIEIDTKRATDESKKLQLTAPIVSTTSGALATVVLQVASDRGFLSRSQLFLHWGSYSPAGIWKDDLVTPSEIEDIGNGQFIIRKVLTPHAPGRYGVTLYAKMIANGKQIWAGEPKAADGQFCIQEEDLGKKKTAWKTLAAELHNRGELLQSLASYERFTSTIFKLSSGTLMRNLGRELFELTRKSPELRDAVSEYYQQALDEFSKERSRYTRRKLKRVIKVLQNLGVGEVVLVSTEGPHATGGGLAQVIVGLLSSLVRSAIPVTLITPLYHQSAGKKHASANDILAEGVILNSKRVPLELVGSVTVPIGPTVRDGSRETVRPEVLAQADVYLAVDGSTRGYFIHSPDYFTKLYDDVWSDENLKRAVFFCRSAVEIIKDVATFDVTPHLLITNDWHTGLIPALLKTDPRYCDDRRLQQIETLHMLHNCGRDYQGRFLLQFFGEDLWPMLGIGGEHFFGLSCPENPAHLNITAGAIRHVTSGILTVSRPYAEQLLTPEGGEGLDIVLRERKELLFGISNGIDIRKLRKIFWQIGERARNDSTQNSDLSTYNRTRLERRFLEYKQAIKARVQQRCGLKEDTSSVLLSFVGRLAEQKGIQLLCSPLPVSGTPVLEAILQKYPHVQIFIGGPPTPGDRVFQQLANLVIQLSQRFPERIQGWFEYIMHDDALEITKGSDLFLMPSRYEPGGISQLEAVAAGTLVVARNVGGISATLVDYDESPITGNSFLFDEYTPQALFASVSKAIEVIHDERTHRELVRHALESEHDWGDRMPQYLALFQYVTGVLDPSSCLPHLSQKTELLSRIRPAIA